MRVDLFDYHLPPDLIAQRPVEPRDRSLLLAVDCEAKKVEHRHFRDLPAYIEEGDCLVFNDSRVRRARLYGHKAEGGGAVELLLLRYHDGGIWEALARPARRLHVGSRIIFGGELEAGVVGKGKRGLLEVNLDPGDPEAVEAILEKIGEIPLPPYIKDSLEDPERYQTVFASEVGSAAAPTAGLHFSDEIMRKLRDRGVKLAFLRLDVGLDTFRPIEEEHVEEHHLHSEDIFLDEEACTTINDTRREGRKVVAVGTTVVRALESSISGEDVIPYSGPTNLFIYPGFRFRVVDSLLTNFHFPRSSLLLMVCAFVGRDLVMEGYRQAVERGYRFLSFGDVCYFYYPNGRTDRFAGHV
jgi:S-adenosylmethionine:tRNA ribosyltransferase-isomerase